MAVWNEDDDLRFSIMDAMRGVKLPVLNKRLDEKDRARLAEAVLERFKLSGIKVTSATPKPFSTPRS